MQGRQSSAPGAEVGELVVPGLGVVVGEGAIVGVAVEPIVGAADAVAGALVGVALTAREGLGGTCDPQATTSRTATALDQARDFSSLSRPFVLVGEWLEVGRQRFGGDRQFDRDAPRRRPGAVNELYRR